MPQFPLYLRNAKVPSHQTSQSSWSVFFFYINNMFKDQLFKTSGLQFDNWLSRPEKFSGLSRNRPLACVFDGLRPSQCTTSPQTLQYVLFLLTRLSMFSNGISYSGNDKTASLDSIPRYLFSTLAQKQVLLEHSSLTFYQRLTQVFHRY